MIQVAGLKHEDSADLLLGLRIRAVRYPDLAAFQAQGFGKVGRLKSLASRKVPFGSQFIVVVKALVQHAVALISRHILELSRLDISQTDKFHDRPLLR